jgi:hypothetical protein
VFRNPINPNLNTLSLYSSLGVGRSFAPIQNNLIYLNIKISGNKKQQSPDELQCNFNNMVTWGSFPGDKAAGA